MWVVNLSIHGLISKALFHLRIDAVWFMRARALKKTFPHRLDNWSCGFQRRGAFFVAGGMWWCKQFWRAPETRSSPNIKREDGRFWSLARIAAVIPRTPLWVCGCPQSACGLCVKKARALICPGLDWRKTLCGRPAAVSGRLVGPQCEVSPVMESVTVAQSSAFFFLLC